MDADLVIPVPDSGNPAARGFARASGLPQDDGLIKNRYVARTFIQPGQELRKHGLRLKFNPLPEVVAGRRIVVVDDSIVRGNTTRQIVQMLRDAGASEVHMRISAPPIRHPCHYGIDMSTREEMIAHNRTEAEVAAELGADSLAYLSLEGVYEAIRGSSETHCDACFSGDYPLIGTSTKVAAELVAAGIASPLERRFARRFTLSVDARAEAAARRRAEQDPVLGSLLQNWPLPPATHTHAAGRPGDPGSGRPHAAHGAGRLRPDAHRDDRRGRRLVREVAVGVHDRAEAVALGRERAREAVAPGELALAQRDGLEREPVAAAVRLQLDPGRELRARDRAGEPHGAAVAGATSG